MRGEFTSFRIPFLGIAVFLAVVAAAGTLAGYFSGPELNPYPILLPGAVVVMAALGAVGGVLTALYYRVHVAPWGIRGFDLWGRYHNVTWDEIADAKRFNFLGWRYVRVRRHGRGSSLWLPLFLVEQRRFEGLVLQWTGPAHPLALALNMNRPPPGAGKAKAT